MNTCECVLVLVYDRQTAPTTPFNLLWGGAPGKEGSAVTDLPQYCANNSDTKQYML